MRAKFIFHGIGITLFVLSATHLHAQQPFIRLTQPVHTRNQVSAPRQYIAGSTCPTCTLTLNDSSVKVYPTGAFALQLDLESGDTTLVLHSENTNGASATKTLYYHFELPPPPEPVKDFSIASVDTWPSGELWLMPGDEIRFRVKAQPGCTATVNGEVPLYEQPDAMPGIYQGTYLVKQDDPSRDKSFTVSLRNGSGQVTRRRTDVAFRLLDPDEPLVGKTAGAIPYMEFGLGTDRLGGAKMTYLDTAVRVHITGRIGDEYRIQLTKALSAYIPVEDVLLLPKGTFIPRSLTGSFRVWGDDRYDYVSIPLQDKLPYRSIQQIDPARIAVDIFGATVNTNWIVQLRNVKEIRNVYYRQLSDDMLRVIIELKHDRHWGYHIYYEGNRLTVRVKRQPEKPDLQHLTIAVDAGHGGRNFGAHGPTGAYEKDLTLQIAGKLRDLLQKAGATVLMTRTTDETRDMIQRTLFLREADPDLLVSIHLNASSDPVHVSGTSTYYRYIGFRPLSEAILDRMLGLGLDEYGNVGRFNFALSGPTEFPNALVETVFLSNPADEMKVLDPVFRQQIARAIVQGIRDFLQQAKKETETP